MAFFGLKVSPHSYSFPPPTFIWQNIHLCIPSFHESTVHRSSQPVTLQSVQHSTKPRLRLERAKSKCNVGWLAQVQIEWNKPNNPSHLILLYLRSLTLITPETQLLFRHTYCCQCWTKNLVKFVWKIFLWFYLYL